MRLGDVRQLGVADVPEQEVAEHVARECRAEGDRPAHRRHVEERVAHRHHHVDAELPLVLAPKQREGVGELKLIRALVLRQEVGRPEPVTARAEVHARQSTRNPRIVRHAGHRDAGLSEWILHCL